jgi:hypothetical protein
MSDQEEKKSGFVVKDNRRFDTSGNERAGEEERQASSASEETPSAKVAASAREVPDEIDFSSFIISLGTQALMQLGELKPPEGIDMPVDKAAAKQTIDILSMLEQKTKGNLEPTEAQLLEEILHNCRIGFVRAG